MGRSRAGLPNIEPGPPGGEMSSPRSANHPGEDRPRQPSHMLIERAGVFTPIGFSIYSMVNRKNRALNAVRTHRPPSCRTRLRRVNRSQLRSTSPCNTVSRSHVAPAGCRQRGRAVTKPARRQRRSSLRWPGRKLEGGTTAPERRSRRPPVAPAAAAPTSLPRTRSRTPRRHC
jgi:hypothetical protein